MQLHLIFRKTVKKYKLDKFQSHTFSSCSGTMYKFCNSNLWTSEFKICALICGLIKLKTETGFLLNSVQIDHLTLIQS